MNPPLHPTQALDMIDWYRRCLEDVQDRKVVRGLCEAKAGYDRAIDYLREWHDELRMAAMEADR